jgi:hypothetical protein
MAEISDLITAESGLCQNDILHEVGRAGDAFTFTEVKTYSPPRP